MIYAVKEINGVKTLTPLDELTAVDLAEMRARTFFRNLYKKIKLIIGAILEYTKTT